MGPISGDRMTKPTGVHPTPFRAGPTNYLHTDPDAWRANFYKRSFKRDSNKNHESQCLLEWLNARTTRAYDKAMTEALLIVARKTGILTQD